jgi:hypothetical protein
MTVFDQAWDIAKEFFFEPESSRMNERESGNRFKMYESIMGRHEAPIVNALRESSNPSSRYLPPKYFEEGKHIPLVLPRTRLMEQHPTLGVAPVNVDNYALEGPLGLNHYVGVNLSAVNQPGRTENQMIDDITSTLAHEYGHAVLDDELMRILYDQWYFDDADRAYKNHAVAHEIGAHTLQHPGGHDDERTARFQFLSHPTSKLSKTPWKFPRASYGIPINR